MLYNMSLELYQLCPPFYIDIPLSLPLLNNIYLWSHQPFAWSIDIIQLHQLLLLLLFVMQSPW